MKNKLKPKISVVMSSYNAEKSLSLCLDSILNQTFTNFEFIICDDGSTDGTFHILKSYSNIDKRIVLLSNEKNEGLAFSLNKCIDASNSNIICRMDADDFSAPNRLEEQFNYFKKYKYDLLGTNCFVFRDFYHFQEAKAKFSINKTDIYSKNQFFHPSIMMRKELFYKVGKFTNFKFTKKSQDYDLWLKLFTKVKHLKAGNFQKPLYFYQLPKKSRNLREYLFVSYLIIRSVILYSNFKDFFYIIFAFRPILSFIFIFLKRLIK